MRDIDRFIRGEVERQGFDMDEQEGATRVSWMTMAWWCAEYRSKLVRARPNVDDILTLGHYVEPGRNRRGFRQTPVFIYEGWGPTVDWRSVPEAVEKLVENGDELTPLEFYTEFELIHPFLDGNGRVGAILYNWLKGTLDNPETPEDVFAGVPDIECDMDEYTGAHLSECVGECDMGGEVGYIVEPDNEPCLAHEECDMEPCTFDQQAAWDADVKEALGDEV